MSLDLFSLPASPSFSSPLSQTKGWSAEAQDEFRRVVGSASVEMQVFGQERGALLVDLKKAPMDSGSSNMPMSLREYLVFLELARYIHTQGSYGHENPGKDMEFFL